MTLHCLLLFDIPGYFFPNIRINKRLICLKIDVTWLMGKKIKRNSKNKIKISTNLSLSFSIRVFFKTYIVFRSLRFVYHFYYYYFHYHYYCLIFNLDGAWHFSCRLGKSFKKFIVFVIGHYSKYLKIFIRFYHFYLNIIYFYLLLILRKHFKKYFPLFIFNFWCLYWVEVYEPKWGNSIFNKIGVNSLRLEGLQISQ